MVSLKNTTTEEILVGLKNYLRDELLVRQRLVKTVKSGLIDIRDEYPIVMVIPLLETINISYSNNLFDINRKFRVDIIDKAYTVEAVRDSLRNKLLKLKDCFSINNLEWNLKDTLERINCINFSLERETIAEPAAYDGVFTQYCGIPLNLNGFFESKDIIYENIEEYNFLELLDFVYIKIQELKIFKQVWRDIEKPLNFDNFPIIGIYIQEPETDNLAKTSSEITNVNLIFRIYSSLATKEIAFINHLRNVEIVKEWILSNTNLEGHVDSFKLTSIDYGIDELPRAYQNPLEMMPIFRSDISTMCVLYEFVE